MFKRYLDGRLPTRSFFLFGPRQVGKSTLLAQLPTLFRVDLLDPAIQLEYSKNPNRLVEKLEAYPKEGMVLLDEIQRAPRLLDVVHGLMEKHPKLHFAMSGSSARKLRHGAANLLGGRALYRTLHPLTEGELAEHFRLENVLSFGSLPKIYSILLEGDRETAADLLNAYVVTYLAEEVKAEALVRNLPGFQNFLDIAAAQFTEQVNFSDIGRACGVAYTTVREFYSILEDTLMGFFLRPFLKSARKRMSHAPKFYFFDNGVTRAMLGTARGLASPLEKGRLFEQWVMQEIVRWDAYREKAWRFFFWRTSHGAEVDLVITRGGQTLCAVECKFKKNLAASDFSGLHAFQEVFPKIPRFLVAPVEGPRVIDKVPVLPIPLLLERIDAL